MSKILALDQATRISGYAIFEDKKLIHYGKIVTEDSDIGIRLNKIRNEVKNLIQQYEITEVVIEDIQLQENVQTFKALAEVFGVIYELVTSLGLPIEAILSTVWKSYLKIKGRTRPEQKRSAQDWVINTYKIKPTQDECDAICIGEYYVNNKTESFDWSN